MFYFSRLNQCVAILIQVNKAKASVLENWAKLSDMSDLVAKSKNKNKKHKHKQTNKQKTHPDACSQVGYRSRIKQYLHGSYCKEYLLGYYGYSDAYVKYAV